MNRWLGVLFRLFLCAASIACVTVRAAADHQLEIPEDFLGVCPTIRLDQRELDLIDSVGARWIRHDFPWDTIEGRLGEWTFEHWDGYIRRAEERKKNILAILDYDVPWIHQDRGKRPYISPDNLPYFLSYAGRVARRYAQRVGAFEIWNEPNTRRFWKGSRREFFRLAAETIDTVRTAAPGARVVAGALLGSAETYLKDMFESGILDQVDALSFHPYALTPDGVMRRIDAVRSMVSRYGFLGELWITEVGFPGWNASSRSETRQAEYAVKILLGAAVRNIDKVFWYELLDASPPEQTRGLGSIENHFGIVRSDLTPKPSFHACSLVGRFVPGSRYVPERVTVSPSLAGAIEVLAFRRSNGTTALFLWSERKRTVRLSIQGGAEDVVEHQLYSGEIHPAVELERFELDRNPRLITFVSRGDPATVTVAPAGSGSR